MVSKSEAFNTPRKVHVMTLVSMQLRTCGVKISDSILCSVSNHTRGDILPGASPPLSALSHGQF